MKKLLALILAVIMIVSISSCGNDPESAENTAVAYVGTYVDESGKYSIDNKYNGTIKTLVLNADGTGTMKREVCEVGSDLTSIWSVGDIEQKADITWTDNGEYITVSFDIKSYYDPFPWIRLSTPEKSFGKHDYVLKSGQLFNYGGTGDGTGYYKVS